MASKHMENYSKSLGKLNLKLQHDITICLVKMFIFLKKANNTKYWQECEETGTLTHCW